MVTPIRFGEIPMALLKIMVTIIEICLVLQMAITRTTLLFNGLRMLGGRMSMAKFTLVFAVHLPLFLFVCCDQLVGQTTPFVLRGKITNPHGRGGDEFGYQISVVGDRIAISARDDGTLGRNAGMVHVFDFDGELLHSFGSPNAEEGGNFGFYMTSVGDNQLLVGANIENEKAGRAYLFDIDGEVIRTLISPEVNPGNQYGGRFLLSNEQSLFVPEWSRMLDDDTYTGRVYKYDRDGNLLTTYDNPFQDADQVNCLGRSAAFVGTDQIVIGDPCNSGPEDFYEAGAAVLFDLEGNFIRAFQNPAPMTADGFGDAVAFAEDRILFGGAQIDDVESGASTGAAYIYDVDGTFVTRVSDPEPKNGNWFGWNAGSMTLSSGEEIFLVGSVFNSSSFPDAGKVHLVNTSGEIIQSLESPDPEPIGKFGVSFTQFGDKLLIGESADGGGLGRGPGAVWIFEPADLGDFDLDGDVDLTDLDTLCLELASGQIEQSLDITGDDLVTHADLVEFLSLAGSVVGDANLDGQVAFDDFLSLSTNFGASNASWSAGNFHCNSQVDFDDFLALSQNFGFDGTVNAVPEPNPDLLILLGLQLLLRGQSFQRRLPNRT